MEPSWKTSEFWTALIGQLAAIAVLVGLVLPQDAETLAQALTQVAEAVILIAGQLAVIWKYIDSRTQVRVAALQSGIR